MARQTRLNIEKLMYLYLQLLFGPLICRKLSRKIFKGSYFKKRSLHRNKVRVFVNFASVFLILLIILTILPEHHVRAAERTVRVGIYQNKPKVFINDKGQADGFFIDLLEKIAKEEGWSITYSFCEWEICLDALEAGQIDLMPDMAYTPQRDLIFDFHNIPAAESWSRIYSNIQTNVDHIDEIDGKTVAVLSDSIQQTELERVAQDNNLSISIITAKTQEGVFQLVANNSANMALTNQFFGDSNYRYYGLIRTPVVFNITTLYYVTAEGKNQDLLNSIDYYLGIWRDDSNSFYYSLTDRWLDNSNAEERARTLAWIIAGIIGILLFVLYWNLNLQKQVKLRTIYLEDANQKLTENEEIYKSLSSLTSDYVFSSRIDKEGKIKYNLIAGGFETITGYTLEEYEALGGWRGIIHPEDLVIDDQDMQNLHANQQVISEIRTITKNGKTNWSRVFAHPTWDEEENRLTAVYGAVQDITEKKIAELELQKYYALLNITGRVAKVGGWEYDVLSEALIGTEEMYRIYEIDPSTQINLEKSIEYYTPESRPLLIKAWEEIIENGTPFYQEVRLITGKGNLIWVSIHCIPEIKEGKVIRIFGAVQDITPFKASEEKFHQQKLRAEALVNTSDHINSKLDFDAVLATVCEDTAQALYASAVALYIYNESDQTISLVSDYGLPAPFREKSIKISINNIPLSVSPLSETPVIIENFNSRTDAPFYNLMNANDIRSAIACKIKSKDQFIGTLAVFSIGKIRIFSEDEISLLQGLSNQAANAITNSRLFENTERQLNNIASLHTIDIAIANSMDIRLTLKIVAEETLKQLMVDAINIFLYKPSSNLLESAIYQGFNFPIKDHVTLHIGEGFAGKVASGMEPLYIPDINMYQKTSSNSPVFEGENFNSYFAVPLRAKGQFIGIMEVFNRAKINPDQQWFTFFETLAGQAAIAIDNIKSFEELQISNIKLILAYDANIEGWSQAMDMRDKETEGHSQRVTKLTIQLAKKMGIDEEQIIHIRRGALLHDIGKLGIPDRILLKNDKLTDKEWIIMRKHPQYAYDLLSSIEYLRPALDIPYCHHEKWDGTGYPRGLKGNQIPMAARIFAVIDVWDAVTSDRPYRPAWSRKEAIEYIKQQSGKHFDPQVVDTFLSEIHDTLHLDDNAAV